MSTSSHPSAEQVSDLVEGLLPPEDARTVESHLADCAECRDLREALADVRSFLGDLPEPRMPAEVADRLDRAVAEVSGEPREPPIDLTARRRRRVLAGAGAAAASLVLVMAGGLVVLRGLGPAGSDDSGGSGAALETAKEHGPQRGAAPSQDDRGRTFAAPGYVTATGTSYAKRSLPERVTALLANPELSRSSGRDDAAAERLADPSALTSCLAGLGAGGTRPLAVDLARYAGAPAAVVVLPVRDNPDVADVWVVAPECSAGDPSVRARARVPRP